MHKDNPLNEITLDQIAQIYMEGGTITKWSDLGVTIPGASSDEIVRVSRQSSSGTYEFLREHVLQQQRLQARLPRHERLQGSGRTGRLHAHGHRLQRHGLRHPGGQDVEGEEDRRDPAYEPNVANTLAKTYPIARSLQVYTLGEPQGAVKKYIDWMMSDAGQKVVEASGYVPLPAEARAKP